MRLTDLELYRWKLHNKFIKSKKHYNYMSWVAYWKEVGAFTSILPRQSGKTTMIAKMYNILISSGENAIIVSNSIDHLNINHGINYKDLYSIGTIESNNPISCFSDCNILIDEFNFIFGLSLSSLLNNPWKSVTCVGGLI